MAETDPRRREVQLALAAGLLANLQMTIALMNGLVEIGLMSPDDRDDFVIRAHEGCLLDRNGEAGIHAAAILQEVFLAGGPPRASNEEPPKK